MAGKSDVSPHPFSLWLKRALDQYGRTTKTLFVNKHLSKAMASYLVRGERAPSRDMVGRVVDAILPEDADPHVREHFLKDALEAAGFTASLLHGTSPTDYGPEPPENWEDWPQELKEAMHYSQQLSSEVQRYIYKLWREQAIAQVQIAKMGKGEEEG